MIALDGDGRVVSTTRRAEVFPATKRHLEIGPVLTEHHPCALVFVSEPGGAGPLASGPSFHPIRADPDRMPAGGSAASGIRPVRGGQAHAHHQGECPPMMKSIFRKTETRRQSHLVRLLMSLLGEAR